MLILIFLFISAASSECPPAVQRTSYSFNGVFQATMQEKVELVWLRGKTPRSICRSNMLCYESDESKTITSIKFLGEGKYEFNLTIINVTKNDESVWSIKYLGLASLRKSSFLFVCNLSVFDISVLTLQDCPLVVDEGYTASCHCSVIGDNNGDIHFGWYDNNNMLQNNGSNLLSFIAYRENIGFQCRGKTKTGLTSLPLSYNPLIVAKIDNFDCALYYNQSDRFMLCKIEKIYPEAVCEIVINGKVVQSILYKSHVWPINSLYFYSECQSILPETINGNITAVITVYPNITGTRKDETFELTKKFNFDLAQIKIYQSTNFKVLIAVICLVLLSISLSIAFLFTKVRIYFKRKKFQSMLLQESKGNKCQIPPTHKQFVDKSNDYLSKRCINSEILQYTVDDIIVYKEHLSVPQAKIRLMTWEEISINVINESDDSEGYGSSDELETRKNC